MAYFHGVKASEIATSIITPVSTTAGLPVVFGTAPVHLTSDPKAYVNKPVICYSWDEAVAALGYSGDWDKYTLSEVMYSQFKLYGISPVVFVNVLDPTKHKKSQKDSTGRAVNDHQIIVDDDVLLSTLVVKKSSASEAAVLGTDYTAAYNDDGKLVITLLETGALYSEATLVLEYDAVDATAVTSADIIGGASADGSSKGLELIDYIYTMFSLVPGIILAPGFSEDPTVAAVMKAKALTVMELFRCTVLADIDTAKCKSYQDVNEWKKKNGYTGTNQIVCWPCVRNGDMIFHFSTHLLGVIGALDADNDDVPYQSPSNRDMQITGLCLKDGTEVLLSLPQANLLNSQGVMTAINFTGGWKSWGNYTGAYPSSTDVKDTFICVRRFFDWDDQTFILTYWQKVDGPLSPRFVKSIVESERVRLNSLVARGYMLGAEVKFLESENSTTDLLQGIFRIHKFRTPPVPAQEIETISEYNVEYLNKLFE
ncbi:phage tail sheath family protein [Mitsuokella sp.]|uniref:phage tail sheath family protein n=1 Tax=Mitsuokella sp. TaxID=2049034 RepID=UPI003D7CC01A